MSIPQELTAYPQWVLWREVIKKDGSRTKLPYSTTGGLASTTDSRTWTTYDKALDASKRLGMGIGFVLSDSDPFAFIDLDDPYKNNADTEKAKSIIERHNKIIESFNSYTEVSPSGTGLHIIIKGAVADGKRRGNVEVYSTGRYMTITGATYKDLPIKDCGTLLQTLWQECGGGENGSQENDIEETQERFSDEAIYNQAKDATNGEKFIQLWEGHWMDARYNSQSEADFALINILSFYSRNVTQIKRMFFLSALGQRDKAKRKTYLDNMIRRSFDNQPAYIPLDTLTTSLLEKLKADSRVQLTQPVVNPFAGPLFENVQDAAYDWTMPPGLLGEIAQYIYVSAPRPVKEIALAGAIGLMSGICGRAYNISGTGLNQYILMLAETGRGKEAMSIGIGKLMRYVQLRVPAATDFIGPSEIASGQAIVKYLQRFPCFISIVGEFGLMLQAMCNFNANSSQIMLRKKLLELYNKSGEKQTLQPTIYSDKEKNTAIVYSPAFSLLGESTPDAYYNGLDETMISQGLLPRFMAIEYLGPRPPLNVKHDQMEPDNKLIDALGELAGNALVLAQNNRVIHVQLDPEAQKFADDFEKITTANINKSDVTVAKELWNRAHLKMLKLSALIAIGINPYEPIATLQCVQWAHTLVERDVQNVFARFESGKVGKATSEGHQAAELVAIVKEYIYRPYDITLEKYGVDNRMHYDKIIALSYIQRRLQARAPFRNDRMGSTIAIKRAIETLITDGALQEVRSIDMQKRYTRSAKAYVITDLSRFT